MINRNDVVVLGALEFSSIVAGFMAMDAMVKTAPVKIIEARTISSGKYLIVFTGDVASVEYAFNKGCESGAAFIVDSLFLPQIHQDVIPAFGHTVKTGLWDAIGIIETKSVISGIEAADAAAKASGVKIIEIRLADGFGGKSYVKMTGSLTDVQTAMEAGTRLAKTKDTLCMDTIIPQPHNEIMPFFM
ncbi:MAG: BMC domain-containing protein [Bacteroidota bacterium]